MKKCSLLLLFLALLLLLVGGVVRAQDEYPAYVVATHYPDFGGTDPAPRDAVAVSYGVYNNRENDYFAVDQERAAAVTARIEEETGLSVIALNRWSDVFEGSEALQIVNNVPVEGALYTIFLPPGWTRDAAMPVVLSGNGAGSSNNDRLYGDADIIPARLAVWSVQGGRGGLIFAISNCGGTESQGVDEPTLRSVGAFFDFMAANGGDKARAVTAGGSRGGGTALMWAINPLGLDYDVVGVFAAVPPTHYGTLSQVSVLTYPALANIATLISHDPNAWFYNRDAYTPGLNPSPYLEAIIGTGDPAEADARGPFGLAEGLAGKQVVLAAGAHDAFFPLSPFLAFDRRLTALDIPHTTIVTLANGHENSDFFMQTLLLYLDGLARGNPPSVPDARYTFIDIDPREDEQVSLHDFFEQRGIEDDPTGLPVIAQFPYRVGVGNPVNVEVCGTPGDAVELLLLDADSSEAVYELSGTLDETECLTEQVRADLAPGTYFWTLTVNGQAINPRNTPTRGADGCGLRAVTVVEEVQLDPRDTFAFNHDMSFGLDEYSGQPDHCR